MKFSIPKTDKILNDKNVLYVVLVVAILNLLGYLLVQNTEAVVFFLIVGYFLRYYIFFITKFDLEQFIEAVKYIFFLIRLG